jgi:mono/diheme cytochrome c family protein
MRWLSNARGYAMPLGIFAIAAFVGSGAAISHRSRQTAGPSVQDEGQVLRGRFLVISHACGECHGPSDNPAATGWLAGITTPQQEFPIGPCAVTPGAQPCFKTRPRNLTPDNTTGIGRFSERQIFNALRYGLRPGETPDVEITSTTPGQGNFPAHPKYLAPPMPWPAWRHMPDQDLRAIAAYLKRALKPVSNKVQDSEGPADFWASEYTVEKIGGYPAPAFPTTNERPSQQDQVLQGRFLVITHDCGACHGGADPAATGWLAGKTTPEQEFLIGPCAFTLGATPCFKTRPRNLTPDSTTGLGRYSERQIFNALRYGLRPGETPDVEITSSTPGQGNFPAHPRYLAVPMPWQSWRYMPDQDLWAIAAYLKRALKPVSNKVQDSEGPPDFWASGYTVEKIGPYPAAAFPTVNEKRPQ